MVLPRHNLSSHPEALHRWRIREREVFHEVFQPAPHLAPSEWAERHRRLSQGPSSGQLWSNAKTPYLVEIMDFVAAPWSRRGVVRKSARVGYTEGVIHNAFGWTVAMDPCPIAIVQPSDDEAKDYSKENIDPFLKANPIVGSRIIASEGARARRETLTHKDFPGGFLSILGAVSDKNMRRRSYKRLFVDEADALKLSAAEGDPLLRFEKRTDDYADDAGVVLVGSTPTILALSRIEKEFRRSDQRFWHVPCPHCRELQVLRWGGPDTPYGIKWDREVCCKGCGLVMETGAEKCACGSTTFAVRHLPETAYYQCEHCGERIEEDAKEAMICAGRMIATNPLGEIPGWHLDAMISLFPAARWSSLVAQFLSAIGDPEELQVFWNTVLGLPWEERSEKVEVASLEKRAEEYVDAKGEVIDVPDGVGVLTAFVDVQGSWLELLVRGWGLEEESWDILHQRITGSPDSISTWATLDAFLTKRYRNVHGVELPIRCTLVDAAYSTDEAYTFTKARAARNVFPSMGDKQGDPAHPPIRHPLRPNDRGVRVVTIGTFKAKSSLFRRLGITTSGPRYLHLRAYNSDRCNGFDAEYFAQFEAEKKVIRRQKGTLKAKPMYVQTRERNEAIDLHVGNMAALMVLGPVRTAMKAWVEAARRPAAATKRRGGARVLHSVHG